jgi:hypothetical protein
MASMGKVYKDRHAATVVWDQQEKIAFLAGPSSLRVDVTFKISLAFHQPEVSPAMIYLENCNLAHLSWSLVVVLWCTL